MIQTSACGEPIKLPCMCCICVKRCWEQLSVVMLILEPGRFLVCEDGVWALPGADFWYLSIALLKKISDVLKFLFSSPPSFLFMLFYAIVK